MSVTEKRWTKPQEVTNLEMAFGGNAMDLMPPHSAIPDEFDNNGWNRLAGRWFFSGLPATTEFTVHEGIDPNVAVRHLKAILGSFESKHEHKQAGVAFLMSQWFAKVTIDGEQVAP